MHIQDILKQSHPSFSFEFFPPKTPEGSEKLYAVIRELEEYAPSFVSVTYGAGGSTRSLTHDLVMRIHETTPTPTIPHITCISHTKDEIFDMLVRYAQAGVGNVLALRGDLPKDGSALPDGKNHFRHAHELVSFIKEFNAKGIHPDKRGFGIGVAAFPEGHPDTPNRLKELDYLKQKVDCGADYLCTQLFFGNHLFFDFRDRCRLAGIDKPIIAGIMPVTTLGGMQRMAELSGGTVFPASLIKALNRADGDADSVEHVGILYAARQCSELLDNDVDGIHFYTLNQSKATIEIYRSLGLKKSKN